MDRPGVGLGILVCREFDLKILLGIRKNAHGAGTWQPPGGHLEKYESFHDCVRREGREETGMDLTVIDEHPVAVTNDMFPENDKHYVTLFFRATAAGQEPRVMEPDKCEEWRWFYWQELPSNLFLPVQNLIKQGYCPFEIK